MKFNLPNLGREHVLLLLVAAALALAVFLFWRRANGIANARKAKSETVDFVSAASANSPPPGADFNMAQVVPIYPGAVNE